GGAEMIDTKIDRIARQFAAHRLSRRGALQQGAAGLAAAGFAAVATRWVPGAGAAPAQGATPPAAAAKAATDPSLLFVQSFQPGGFAAKAGSPDAFTLTLDHGLGQTVFFSDRPERVVGAVPTAKFLQRFPFGAANPPNAALVLAAGPDDTDVVVAELTAPRYRSEEHTSELQSLTNLGCRL